MCYIFSPLGYFAFARCSCFVFSLFFVVLLDLDNEKTGFWLILAFVFMSYHVFYLSALSLFNKN